MLSKISLILAVLVVPVYAADPIQDNLRPVFNANTYKGRLAKYHLNGLTVHTYQSVEAYQDWSIVFEGQDHLVLLEPQSMPNSAKELSRYMGTLGKSLEGVLTSYHGVGPDSFPGVPVYASPAAIEFVKSGKSEKLLEAYGEKFPGVDPKVVIPTRSLGGKKVRIGDIEFEIRPDDGAYPMPGVDVALPEHKMFYMHMLGGDTHSILNSVEEIDPFITYLKGLKEEGFEIFLCSHHMPESVADLESKIEYLETVKEVAAATTSKDEFISEMKRIAPTQRGEHYLEMTAGNLYK